MPFRLELRAHPYRMLGSFHDTEDVAMQIAAFSGNEKDEAGLDGGATSTAIAS